MEEKYILSEEDVGNLSLEQSRDYNEFFNTIYDKGIVYEKALNSFDEILQQQYTAGVLFNPDSTERYPKVLAVNLQNVIQIITNVRNKVIVEGRRFEQQNFQSIYEGLDVLKKFVEETLCSSHYRNSAGINELQKVLPRIEQLQDQISKDMQFYQGYRSEKISVSIDYMKKKDAYDESSLFGKFVARVNGKKKELEEARQKNTYYNSMDVNMGNQQLGNIINPCQYDDYVESQEHEQTTGGMGK